MAVLYRTPSPRPRVHELLPAVTYAALATARLGATAGLVPSLAYVVYLGLDWRALPQSRLVKWIRNASPLVFALAAGPLALRALGVPPLARGALAAVTLGAAFPYLYERGRVALDFIRGSVAAALLELAALGLAPTPLGLHIALPVFAAAYAWERRTVFHRYAVVGLAVYVCSVTALLGGGMELSLHAAAGLAAWLVTRALPDRRPSSLALYPAGIVGPATTESAPADREGTP
jgi:hypothetical protein